MASLGIDMVSTDDFRAKLAEYERSGDLNKDQAKRRTEQGLEAATRNLKSVNHFSPLQTFDILTTHLCRGNAEMLIAKQIVMWMVHNSTKIMDLVRTAGDIMREIGRMLAKVDWWEVLAAAVGGLIIGGLAVGTVVGVSCMLGASATALAVASGPVGWAVLAGAGVGASVVSVITQLAE